MKRVIISGVVAGLAFFLWLSIVHVATPMGQVGISALPDEPQVLAVLKAHVTEPGLYLFPGAGTDPKASKEERQAAMKAAMAKWSTGPTGLMVVYPNGLPAMTATTLLRELSSDLLQGLLLAWLVWNSTLTSMSGRVKFAIVVGIAAACATNLSYWNWYGFPTNYTAVYMFGEISGYAAMGVAIAITLGERRASA